MSIDWEESASKEQIIDKLKKRIAELEAALERLGSEEAMNPPFTNDSQEVDDRIYFARNELNRIRGSDE